MNSALTDRQPPYPRTTAEQLALRLIISDAWFTPDDPAYTRGRERI